MAALLVSVRDVAEVALALEGGAALIDVKHPGRGSLGRADDVVVRAVLDAVAERRPVSAALGELADWSPGQPVPEVSRLAYLKWGLANCPPDWLDRLQAIRQAVEPVTQARVVLTAYADWRRARSPAPAELAHRAILHRFAVLLIDTWHKDGSTLLDWMPAGDLSELALACHAGGVQVALAGSIGNPEIEHLADVRADWFAVRGAACRSGQRDAGLDLARVRALVATVNALPRGS